MIFTFEFDLDSVNMSQHKMSRPEPVLVYAAMTMNSCWFNSSRP